MLQHYDHPLFVVEIRIETVFYKKEYITFEINYQYLFYFLKTNFILVYATSNSGGIILSW
jgi:hypothetical protein